LKTYRKTRELIGKKLLIITDWLEHTSAFLAIRQGMIMLLPLLIISTLDLLFMKAPIPIWQKFITEAFGGRIIELFEFTYHAITGNFAILFATSTSISYALLKRKEMKKKTSYSDALFVTLITLTSLCIHFEFHKDLLYLDQFSNRNMLTALLVSLISGKFYFLIKEQMNAHLYKRTVKEDNFFIDMLEGITTSGLIIVFFFIVDCFMETFLGIANIQELVNIIVSKIIFMSDIPWLQGVGVLFFTQIMWFFGIHGTYAMENVVLENFSGIGSEIYNETFQNVFLNIGGSGSGLCLAIAIIIFSKKKNIRNVAMLATPSLMFNVSEIMLFGLPVIFNPIFLIPFLLVPLIHYFISYIAIYAGIVPQITQQVDWVTPLFVNSYRACDSYKGIILQLFCIAVGVCIYKPFVELFGVQQEKYIKFKIQELTFEYKKQEEVAVFTCLTEREDEIGSTARALAADLEKAIKNRELYMLYQPQIDCSDVCTGAEALLRWEHPIAGFIYPPLIIQLAKEKCLLSKLEEYIFDTVAGAIKEIEKDVDSEFKVTVNITGKSLEWEGFEECLQKCVEKHGISTKQMWLEITESDALSSSNEIIDKLKKLKDKGFKFLIDDFGMGHTSMLYLQTSYFDVVKLDGSLTRDVLENDRNMEIIASIVHLGRSLNFATVAEYVETREQRGKLEVIGCDAFQGYLYSEPIHLNALINWMQVHNA